MAQAYVLKVFPDAVGLTPDGRQNLMAYGNMVFNAFGALNDIFHESVRDLGSVAPWIMEQCRRENLTPGLLGDQVYQAVGSGQISEDEALILVRSFLSAGVDTTVDAVGNALWAFATHPEPVGQGQGRSEPRQTGVRGIAALGIAVPYVLPDDDARRRDRRRHRCPATRR